jgi:hypothetical protein
MHYLLFTVLISSLIALTLASNAEEDEFRKLAIWAILVRCNLPDTLCAEKYFAKPPAKTGVYPIRCNSQFYGRLVVNEDGSMVAKFADGFKIEQSYDSTGNNVTYSQDNIKGLTKISLFRPRKNNPE